jgi:hypothetical protein
MTPPMAHRMVMAAFFFAPVLSLTISFSLARSCLRGCYTSVMECRGTLRDGKLVRADGVFDAWTSGNLNRMMAQINTLTHPVDRHFLLMGIVNESYKIREQPEWGEVCVRVARTHLAEFPQLAIALKRNFNGTLPNVATFVRLATVLTERGDYGGAINVCQQAISYGLADGTKGGWN